MSRRDYTVADRSGPALTDHGSTGSSPTPAPQPPNSPNVPWLRLVGTPVTNTTGVFSNVTVIQRIDTTGGVTPTNRCPAPTTKAVDYTANYVFWAKK